MDKKYSKNGKFKSFLKRNMYYIIMGVCIVAIGAMITVAILAQKEPTGPVNNNNEPTDIPQEPEDPPVVTDPIVFQVPVASENVIRDYDEEILVQWVSLKGIYKVHLGIDYGGDENTDVVAAYGGKVIDVTNDLLNGYVVKIDHGDGLITSYGSLGDEPVVTIGQDVTKGTVLGKVGTSAGNEMALGAHVHFAVFKDGKIVNPYEYLPTGDK